MEADENNDEDDGQAPQEVNGVAAALTAERVSDPHLSGQEDGSPRPAERQRLLPSRDPSPARNHDEAESCSDSHGDHELNNKADSDSDNGKSRPAKRKRPSSSCDSPMQKKRRRSLQQRSTAQYRPRSKPRRRSPKSHSLLDQGSSAAAVSSPKRRLLSPAPSASHPTDRDMSLDCYNLDRSSEAVQPTLTEVTFRPHSSPDLYSFTAIVRVGHDRPEFSLVRFVTLIENMSYIEDVDIHTVK